MNQKTKRKFCYQIWEQNGVKTNNQKKFYREKKQKERNFFLFKESENALSQTENMQWTYHYDKNELKKKNNLDATNSPTNTYKK